MTLSIDIISDVVCPWCFIAKRRLEAAVALYCERFPENPPPQVRWFPFQLNPELPAEGISRDEHMARKFGPKKGGEVHAQVKSLGSSVGIAFAFDRIRRQPNTLASHSLIALAGEHGLQDEMVEALFTGYFLHGADLTQDEVLVRLAVQVGLPSEEVTDALGDRDKLEQVSGLDEQARGSGVEGVPFFIFNRKLAASGAHEPQSLLEAMIKSEAPPAAA